MAIAAAYLPHWLGHEWTATIPRLASFAYGVFELMNMMWWGIRLGMVAVGLLSKTPAELVVAAFLVLSMVVALVSGAIAEGLVQRGVLPPNPHAVDLPESFAIFSEARKRFRAARFGGAFFADVAWRAVRESGMILRWILFGVLLAALLRALLSPEQHRLHRNPRHAGNHPLVENRAFPSVNRRAAGRAARLDPEPVFLIRRK